MSGSSSVGRASAFQAGCREFESRLPLQNAHVAQSVERFLGKEEVHRFNPGRGLHFFKTAKWLRDTWQILFIALFKMRKYKHNNCFRIVDGH